MKNHWRLSLKSLCVQFNSQAKVKSNKGYRLDPSHTLPVRHAFKAQTGCARGVKVVIPQGVSVMFFWWHPRVNSKDTSKTRWSALYMPDHMGNCVHEWTCCFSENPLSVKAREIEDFRVLLHHSLLRQQTQQKWVNQKIPASLQYVLAV